MNDHHHTKAIVYLRVSTDRQGKSGLGLEAQREAVSRYLTANGLELIAEHVEVETGKGSNALAKRPQLVAALAEAKRVKALLIVAKLDRLARNTRFLLTLIDSGADVAFADMPQVAGPMGRFIITQMAAVAELEAGLISQRTKAALVAAKERGQELGKHGKVQAARNKAEAVERLKPVAPILRELKEQGLSMRQMILALNDRGITSPAGRKWHLASLHKALTRVIAAPPSGGSAFLAEKRPLSASGMSGLHETGRMRNGLSGARRECGATSAGTERTQAASVSSVLPQ